jgi:heme exporter protein D
MLDLDMTPYAAFVWPAWGISALVLAALVARAVIASRRWKRELKRLEEEQMRTDRTPIDRAQAVRSAIAQPE